MNITENILNAINKNDHIYFEVFEKYMFKFIDKNFFETIIENEWFYYIKGFYYEKIDFDEAEKNYILSNNYLAYYRLGKNCYDSGSTEQAIKYLKLSLNINNFSLSRLCLIYYYEENKDDFTDFINKYCDHIDFEYFLNKIDIKCHEQSFNLIKILFSNMQLLYNENKYLKSENIQLKEDNNELKEEISLIPGYGSEYFITKETYESKNY